MGRWAPDARGRLVEAAFELYRERGYDATTVADIAARAGLTERTFFRYFADKREVLFAGSDDLREFLIAAVKSAPFDETPLEVVATALASTGTWIEQHAGQQGARFRNQIVLGHAELRERELIKLATLGAAIGEALRARGVKEPTASLVAETGIAVFKIAFERWVSDPNESRMADHVHAAVTELRAIAATTAPKRRRA